MIARETTLLGGVLGLAWAGSLAVVAAGLPEPARAAAEERPGDPAPVEDLLRSALEAYDDVRVELAADRLEGVPAAARRLAGALRLALPAGATLSGDGPSAVAEAAWFADSLAGAEDLLGARTAFGEVSRFLLLLAGSNPGMAGGWHVFSCPMTETFDRWMQPTEALANPYMGSAMLACGSPVEGFAPALPGAGETQEAVQEAGLPGAAELAAAEPEFTPGIPGLRMADVRDHKHLWHEIDELQVWEHGDRISIAEYRNKVIEKTAQFLGLAGAAADAFAAVASGAVVTIRESFLGRQGADDGAQGQFAAVLREAVSGLTSLLQDEPRHRLFAPECKKWLLRLAFGPSESKEARESRRSGASGDERQAQGAGAR